MSEDVGGCIQACPVQAYTDGEYTTMWGISNGIGLIGFSFNLFMACTWLIAGKKHFDKVPYQLKFCVFAGLLFSLVATLPSLALKYISKHEHLLQESMEGVDLASKPDKYTGILYHLALWRSPSH
jgi:hypothetical protein